MVDATATLPVRVEDIRAAAARIEPYALRTPLLRQLKIEDRVGGQVFLKAENLQRVGAFKFRGAFNTLKLLQESENADHVITSSSGNHGQAVAAAGQILGIKVTVVMPVNAVEVKVDAVRGYGGQVEFAGTTSPEREAKAREIGSETGGVVIGSFDDARIIAGQGTVGLEIASDAPDVETVLVPVGGGGLIAGIATAVKALQPSARIVGVEPEGASDTYQSMRAGSRISIDRIDTIADGLRTSAPGVLNFEIMRRLVDDIILVSDDDMRTAMRILAFESKLTVEPSGSVGVAALVSGKATVSRGKTVAVISGGNVDPRLFAEILTG